MTIERIFIPTVKRHDNQISYNNLPDALKKRVTMVVRPSERNLYNYDCDYITIPESLEDTWTELSQVRKLIHKEAGNIKYAVIDDDILLLRRNAKYWTGVSNMEKSKRNALDEDILDMYDVASKWLDEPDIGIVGLSDPGIPPHDEEFKDTKPVYSYIFYDGRMISKVIDEMDITSVRVAEDRMFLFEALSRGINTRKSNEFIHDNRSMFDKKMQDTRIVWTELYGKGAKTKDIFDNWHEYYKDGRPKSFYQSEEHYVTMRYIQKKYPYGIKIYEEDGKLKTICYYKKIYQKSQNSQNSLRKWIEES